MRAVSVNVSIPHTKPSPRTVNVLKTHALEPSALAADLPFFRGSPTTFPASNLQCCVDATSVALGAHTKLFEATPGAQSDPQASLLGCLGATF